MNLWANGTVPRIARSGNTKCDQMQEIWHGVFKGAGLCLCEKEI